MKMIYHFILCYILSFRCIISYSIPVLWVKAYYLHYLEKGTELQNTAWFTQICRINTQRLGINSGTCLCIEVYSLIHSMRCVGSIFGGFPFSTWRWFVCLPHWPARCFGQQLHLLHAHSGALCIAPVFIASSWEVVAAPGSWRRAVDAESRRPLFLSETETTLLRSDVWIWTCTLVAMRENCTKRQVWQTEKVKIRGVSKTSGIHANRSHYAKCHHTL